MKTATVGTTITERKRGRPAIDFEIRRFIRREASQNKMLAPGERLPIRVLAYEIHEKLLVRYKGSKRAKIPKVGTIQKEIQKCYKSLGDIDKPWSVQSLSDFPISPEALPTVLRLWVRRRELLGRDLTIRQAQWVARLYALAKDIHISDLAFIADRYADHEGMSESSESRPLLPDKSLDLALFELMTGEVISSERAEKILGHKETSDAMQWEPEVNKWANEVLGEMVPIRVLLREMREKGGKK